MFYLSILSLGQTRSANDLVIILEYIKGYIRKCRVDDLHLDDAWRSALKSLSTFCFSKVFERGPAYMLFMQLHSLTGKAPYTKEQIEDDITSWVSGTMDGSEKMQDEDIVEKTLDSVFFGMAKTGNGWFSIFQGSCK